MPDTPIIARAEHGGGLSVGRRVLVGDRHTDPVSGAPDKQTGGPLHVVSSSCQGTGIPRRVLGDGAQQHTDGNLPHDCLGHRARASARTCSAPAKDEDQACSPVSPACSHPHHCDTVRGRALDELDALSGCSLFGGIVRYG
jgi:hypothetical protein